ncbi:hypothetical protein Acr_27g0008160 [Actinidia rufa]|uniref:Sieve element occlusion N-terminal domain-containing protein n=1 Tax=Actinidia rufa TaxID=165716 RepID=A0A7J0H7J3_9ERIC|nr:hypothetical protein Acr_27g0008160 [Actinidia rufa]
MSTNSDNNVLMEQIQGTHNPDCCEIDVKPLLHIFEDIVRRATPIHTNAILRSSAWSPSYSHQTSVWVSKDSMVSISVVEYQRLLAAVSATATLAQTSAYVACVAWVIDSGAFNHMIGYTSVLLDV